MLLEPERKPKSKAEGSFKCFYCDEYFYSNDERRNNKDNITLAN
jgi:hypothetical protein